MPLIPVIVFLIAFLALLLWGHFLVYISLVNFFSLTDAPQKFTIALLLAILSLSFFVSSAIAHYYENIITRAVYFLSGFWLGLLVNLMLACSALWIVMWVGQRMSFAPNKPLLASLFLGAALLVSFYGVWNALHPVVEHVTVRIPGLPENWKGQTIVQLSDVHLGHVYQAGFLNGVVAEVNKLHPKMVVLTGDLFDGMDGHLDSLVQPFNAIKAPEGVFFITGNHETYLGVEKAFAALEGTQVTILNDEVRDVDGLRLIGIDFPKRGEIKDVITTLLTLREQYVGHPNVLLYHVPQRIAEIAASGVNLMLAGHTHRGQQWPFQFVTYLVHHGFDYGLYPIGDFTLYTSSGVGTWGPAMRLGTQSEIVAITLE